MNNYLKSLWLTETIRLIEKENGRFQDDEANRQARAIDGTFSDRLIKRAETISEQNGLATIQSEWISSAKISSLILLVIALFTGAGLAFSALSQNPVNLYWALLCLLGIHLVTLFLWAITCFFLPKDSGSLFINIWFWLTRLIYRKKTAIQLLPAFMMLFGQQIRWLIGLVVNLIWTIILFAALTVLVILLSTKSYSFEWQSTLLSADAIVSITHFLGQIPSALGFSMPDIDMIRSSEQAITHGDVRSVWAVWLLGIFIVYGLSVRVMLVIFCWIKWTVTCPKLVLNTKHTEYQQLVNELEPKSFKSITDEECVKHDLSEFNHNSEKFIGANKFLVAVDIEESWQPPEQINFLGFLNSSEQRNNVLDFLQKNPAKRLLIAINSDRSPDRGMVNLLQSLAKKSVDSKIWFINQGRQLDNWHAALVQLNIEDANINWLID